MLTKHLLIGCCVVVLGLGGVAMAADSAVADAAMNGDIAAVRDLIGRKADVNAPQGDGTTALHWAVYNGNTELTQLLLASGASVTATTRLGGLTPVMMAAKTGDAAALALLLDAPGGSRAAPTDGRSNASVANSNGTTPLMFAAASGKGDAVKLLLDRGADINAKDTHGQSALMFAAAQGRVDAIKVLLQRKADPDLMTNVSPIVTMTERYKQQTEGKGTRGITSEGGRNDINSMGGMNALMFAAREGYLSAVHELVGAGANVNAASGADSLSVLTLAIVNGRFDIAKYLLDHGADPKHVSKSGLGPLYATVDAQWPERTWYPPASVTEEKTSYLELMKALLAKGADPNARLGRKPWYRTFHGDWADPSGATPFWLAAKADDVEAMKTLIAGGANPSIPSAKGAPPLLVAAGYGFEPQVTNFAPHARLAAVKYLVEDCGADVNARDAQGYSPLHGAALTADHTLIMYLVAMGADVTARAKNVFGGEGQADKDAEGDAGDTVADMANGPRAHNMQFPATVEFLVHLGSESSNNCRYATCVIKTLPSKASKQH